MSDKDKKKLFNPDEFNSEGPYGVLYFDTAAPFTVSDLNASLSGDVNLDETVNIQDILLIINNVLGNINFNTEQNQQADTNNDNIIDILDIISLVNFILNPQPFGWDFETEWTGSDSYIFVQYDPNITNSTALWLSNTKQTLLDRREKRKLAQDKRDILNLFLQRNSIKKAEIDAMKDEIKTLKSMLNDLASKITS